MIDIKTVSDENNDSLQKYKALFAGCSDSQLSAALPAGWTVSAVLCHLAYWDRRALILLKKWQEEGVEVSPVDIDVTNDTTKDYFLAIPPRHALEIFFKTAETVDARIASLDPVFASDVMENSGNVHVSRAYHRLMHFDEIEAALKND